MKEGEMEGKEWKGRKERSTYQGMKERWKPCYEGRGNGRKGRKRKEGKEYISRNEGKVEAML
jgi:hypothetical protein